MHRSKDANQANGIALAWCGDSLRPRRRFEVKFIRSSIVLVSFHGITLFEPKFYQCPEPVPCWMGLRLRVRLGLRVGVGVGGVWCLLL